MKGAENSDRSEAYTVMPFIELSRNGTGECNMNEFIEKLIKEISNKKDYFQRLYECEGKTEHDADLNKATQLAFDDCLSVIEQLAEEYNNDFCEWKIYGNGKHAVTSHGQVKYKYEVEDWCICPYCGKKIKVVE